MADKVRVGFIGCGGNARGHMGRTAQLDFAEVAACCDRVRPLAEQAAAPYGAAVFTDLNQMLDSADLDAVCISIPVFAHGEPERAVIERGLPFLVEKPVGRYMAEVRELEQLVAEAGVITAVGYQLRYAATVDTAREVLQGETVGLAAGTYWCGTGRGESDRWTVQFEKSGGQLLEQATHTIDMMRYLVGEIEEVFCYTAKRHLFHHDSPDIYVVSWRYENGALGNLTTVWSLDRSDWRYANQVDLTADGLHLHWSTPTLTVKRGEEEVKTYEGAGPNLDEVFCRAVQTGDDSAIRSPYSDGVKSMAVSIAALESARTGQPVRVADVG